MSRTVYEVEIRVEIREKHVEGGWTGQRFNTSETVQIELAGFADIAAALGQFHQLAERIQAHGPRS